MHLMKSQELRESKERLVEAFNTLDRNSDKIVSAAELVEGYSTEPKLKHEFEMLGVQPQTLTKVFGILDADGNGSLTLLEFVDRLHTVLHANSTTFEIDVLHELRVMHAA